ncbi:hypothetical protein FAGKG844_100133 [Frankia sp. AgKG'84/4]
MMTRDLRTISIRKLHVRGDDLRPDKAAGPRGCLPTVLSRTLCRPGMRHCHISTLRLVSRRQTSSVFISMPTPDTTQSKKIDRPEPNHNRFGGLFAEGHDQRRPGRADHDCGTAKVDRETKFSLASGPRISLGCRLDFTHELDLLLDGLRAAAATAAGAEAGAPHAGHDRPISQGPSSASGTAARPSRRRQAGSPA